MKKRLIVIAAALLIVGGLVVFLLNRQLEQEATLPAASEKEMLSIATNVHGAVQAPAITPIEAVPASKALRLAIGSLGFSDDAPNRQLADLVTVELSSSAGLQLVERQSLDKVLNEIQLSLSGLVRAKDAVRVGKFLKADWFLLGTPSVVNGTNVLVVRIVDALTGITRDADMCPRDAAVPTVAAKLASFVRQARKDAANPQPKTYLAIGGFEDLSVNSRQASLPSELRSYLTAAYQGSAVTLLEREFVSTLLQELNLDLAGRTEGSSVDAPKPMQAAYWMADGYYQSYETTNFQVELVLNVRRMFGRSQQFALRETPGEALFHKVKTEIDHVMEQYKSPVVLARVTELKAQMATGKELAAFDTRISEWIDLAYAKWYGDTPENEVARSGEILRRLFAPFRPSSCSIQPTARQRSTSRRAYAEASSAEWRRRETFTVLSLNHPRQKFKAATSKFQGNSKFQTSKFRTGPTNRSLEFGASLEFGG